MHNDFSALGPARNFTLRDIAAAYRALGDQPQAYSGIGRSERMRGRAIARRSKKDEK